jgi:branched-chain amino acid transport system ATP-binding protein
VTEHGLTIEELTVRRGDMSVVRAASLTVPAGEITALLGPNGAGKSSLVLALAGALPAVGTVRFGEHELLGQRPDVIRRHGVACVPEGHALLCGLSVRDNLAAAATCFPRREVAGRIDEVLSTFPELDCLLDRRAGLLSGGEQQMVAIGQALVCRPQVLVIDEMSMGLAPIVVDRLLRVLAGLAASGIAVLLIEQFTDKALAVASSAHVMSGGVMTFSGRAAALAASRDIIHSAYLGVRAAAAEGASHA